MRINTLLESAKWKKLPPSIRNHGVFKNINYINKPFHEIGLFNSYETCEIMLDNKLAYIGFSASNISGLWDIATMSMRGVCSCMHWDNPHSRHLLGSVTDPFLGIIYISDNSLTPFGITFKRRSLVRFAYNPNEKTYHLVLERVYKDTGNTNPLVYDNRDESEDQILAVFKRFLQTRVGDKYKVISYKERPVAKYYREYIDFVPRPESLTHMGYDNWSMSDCHLTYRDLDDEFAKKFTKQI